MTRFFGKIGFVMTEETRPGIWEELERTREYYGDLKRNQRRWSSRDELNDEFNISNEVSILADPFAYDNLEAMKWVEVMGSKWKINSVTIEYPRITLTLGGVYNG